MIAGPTASGKSALAVSMAQRLHTEIISADSRQIYQGLRVTTASPSDEQLAAAKHHLVNCLPLEEYYSASRFREDALRIVSDIMEREDYAIVCGGSMMYIDALCNGMDELPTVPAELRERLSAEYKAKGDEWLLGKLKELDSDYYERVDRCNMKRVFHAVEVTLTAGKPYSTMLTGRNRKNDEALPWRVLKFALRMPRNELFDRINRRTEAMAASGMIEEVRALSALRNLNSMNTVGVKEMLKYIDGEWPLDFALARLAKNTRVYAKKQLTWLQKDESVIWLDIDKIAAEKSIGENEDIQEVVADYIIDKYLII